MKIASVFLACLLLLTVVPGASAAETSDWAFVEVSDIVEEVVPSAPVLTGSVDPDSGKPVLTWNAVDGASNYNIYRAESGQDFVVIGSTMETTCEDTDAAAETAYSYKVTAVNDTGAESEFSNEVTVTAAPDIIASGAYGENIYDVDIAEWILYSNGTLTITGVHDVGRYEEEDYACTPWYPYREQVKKVIITGNFKRLNQYAFYGMTSLVSVEIPDTVTEVWDEVFAGCASLVSVEFPDGVTRWGDCILSGCTSLTSVKLPEDITEIPGGLFQNCASLTAFEIPSTVRKIGSSVFYGSGLKSISIPDGVVSIGSGAFQNCTNLTTIDIPDSVKSINDRVFSGCTGLTFIAIPDSVTSIGDSTFSGCTGLTSITVPDSITTIGDSVFSGCTGLTSITVPDSVTAIGDSVFSGCTGLASITIPDSVKSIGDSVFSGCTGLASIIIPDSVKTIGSTTFSNCTGLSSITIPNNVTKIGNGAFQNCTGISAVTLSENLTAISAELFSGCANLGRIIIPANVTTIGTEAFANCSSLSEISFSGNAPTIADDAFLNVTAAVSYPLEDTTWTPDVIQNYGGTLTWPEDTSAASGTWGDNLSWNLTSSGILTISGSGAMDNAESEEDIPWYNYRELITKVELDADITTIGDYAFYGCTEVSEIPIPTGITYIGDYAFWGCKNLSDVTIPEGVAYIGDYAFCNCEKISGITIPNGVTSIGNRAFGNCKALTSITIPASVTDLSSHAFAGCTGLMSFRVAAKNPNYSSDDRGVLFNKNKTELIQPMVMLTGEYEIPKTVATIPDNAFIDQTDLVGVIVPDGIEMIDTQVFYNCSSLEYAKLPDTVKTISINAFYGCSSLKEMVLPKSLELIDWDAFSDCTSLSRVVFPDGITTIDWGAFTDCISLKSVVLPDSITTLAGDVFYNCTALEELTLSANITTIPNCFVYGCTSLKSIIIPEKVETVSMFAFLDCTGLKEVTFTGNAPEILDYAFENVTATVYYPSNNDTWTADLLQNYGGNLTWVGYEKELSAPVISTSNVTSSGKIKVSWDAVPGASKYYVYRKVGSSGSYKYLTSTTKTSLTNTSTEAGKAYYYKVKSVDASGNTSGYSNVSSRTCDLAQPVLTLSGVSSTGKIKLSWDAVDGAQKYYIYRRVGSSGEYKYYTSTTMTSLNNTSTEAGTIYYYKVKAVHENSAANSAYSSAKSRTCDLPSPLLKISNVVSSGKIKLTWDAVDGAVKYYIYRSTSKDGTYNYLCSTTKTSFTNTGAEAGRTYYYKVKAVHENSAANSAYSSVAGKLCKLARPVVSITLSSSGKPKLTWDAIDGAQEYHIFRSTKKDGPYVYQYATTKTSYTNTGAKAGTTYYYKVKAIHSNSAANSVYSYIDSIQSQ